MFLTENSLSRINNLFIGRHKRRIFESKGTLRIDP